jgi:hypothetical protein
MHKVKVRLGRFSRTVYVQISIRERGEGAEGGCTDLLAVIIYRIMGRMRWLH